MSNSNDQRGGQGSSLLALTPASGKRKEKGSLLAFPTGAAADDTPAERHALARSAREAQGSDQAAFDKAGDRSDDKPSFVEKFLRRSRTDDVVTDPTPNSSPDFETTIERVEAMLRRQEDAMSRLADEVEMSAHAPIAEPQVAVNHAAPMPVAESVHREAEDEWKPLIDPARVIRGVVDSRNLIVALTILGGALGVLVALSSPKMYEATAEIVIDPRDLRIGDRPLTDTNGLPSDSTIALVENQVRVLSSGTVLTKVVDELNLESDPEFNGDGAGFDLNPINHIRSLLSRNDGTTDPGRLRGMTVANLAHQVNVFRTGRSFVVLVSAKTTNPEKSALIANKMTEVFVETSGDMQSDSAGRANAEVVGQLERLRDDLEAAEQQVEKFRAENDLVGAQGRLITDDEIIKLNEQLGAARARAIELNARAETARSMSLDAIVGGAIPEVAASGAMAELRAQYSTAKQEADRTAVRLGPRHPTYQAAQSQVATLSRQISAELKRIAAQVQTELKRSVQLEQDLAARLAQLKVRQGDVSGELVKLRELERDAQAKRSVYEGYLLRANETSEQKEINSSNVSVISAATAPLKSTGPSRSIIAATGALLGMLAGIGIGATRGLIGGLGDAVRGVPAGQSSSRGSDAPAGRSRPGASRVGRREEQEPVTDALEQKEEPVSSHYPPYGYAPYPQQPAAPVAQPAYPYAQPAAYPPGYPPPAHVYPQQAQAYPYPPQAYQQPWQHVPPPAPSPASMYYHPQAQPVAAAPYPPYPQPQAQAPQPAAASVAPAADSLAQISESVREFRDAVRELAETRLRRRYF